MNAQSNYPSAHHGLLVLSNQRNQNPRNGLSLQLTLSNQIPQAQKTLFSQIEGIQPISPRTLVQKNNITKIIYESNVSHLKKAICDVANELQTLVVNSKKDLAASLYYHLKDSINNVAAHNVAEPISHFLYESLIAIDSYLFNQDGSLKTLTSSDIKRINSIIEDCKTATIYRIEANGTQWCAYDALGDYCNLERLQKQGVHLLNHGINVIFKLNNQDNFAQLERLLQEKDLTRAWNIIKKIDSRNRTFFESLYNKCFEENFNIKGIDRRFLNDPMAQDLIQRLPNSIIPSVHNIELERRFNQKNKFLDRCCIENPTAEVELFAYQLCDRDLPLVQKLEMICNYVCSSDHKTYQQLCFANGLPRLARYNPEVALAQFPESFHTQIHAKDKILISRLGLLDTSDITTKEYVNRVITYIQQGCSEHSLAKEFSELGHLIGNAILHDESKWCLSLPDMMQEHTSEHLGIIKQKVMKYIAEHAHEDNSFCSRIGTLYERALHDDEVAQSFLEQALIPEISEQILFLDIDSIHAEVSKFNVNNSQAITIMQFNRLADAYKDIQKNGVVYSEKTCPINIKTRLLMFRQGEKYEQHHIYRGNQLEHALHDNILENYERSASFKKKGVQTQIKNLVEIADKSNVLADQSLKIRNYENAINLSMFASYTYDFIESFGKYLIHAGTQIVEGSAEGVISGVKSVAHQVAHPVETVKNVACGLGHLTIFAWRILKHPPSILPLLKDPVGASEYYDNYYREIGIDPELIEKWLSQLTLKDVAKETAQFLTEGILAGEIFKFSGSVCKTLKNQARLIAHDAELVNVSDKIAVAAGEIELRFAQEVETGVLKNCEATTQSFIREATGLECPPSCVNQYEKLKGTLRVEEFTSIIDVSEHGLQRLIERNFTPTEVHNLFKTPDILKVQADGALVLIKQIENNKFNLMIYNPEKKIVITALKSIKENDLISLSKNYGWNL